MSDKLYEQIFLPLYDYLSVFDEGSARNREIDWEIEVAKYAVREGIPMTNLT